MKKYLLSLLLLTLPAIAQAAFPVPEPYTRWLGTSTYIINADVIIKPVNVSTSTAQKTILRATGTVEAVDFVGDGSRLYNLPLSEYMKKAVEGYQIGLATADLRGLIQTEESSRIAADYTIGQATASIIPILLSQYNTWSSTQSMPVLIVRSTETTVRDLDYKVYYGNGGLIVTNKPYYPILGNATTRLGIVSDTDLSTGKEEIYFRQIGLSGLGYADHGSISAGSTSPFGLIFKAGYPSSFTPIADTLGMNYYRGSLGVGLNADLAYSIKTLDSINVGKGILASTATFTTGIASPYIKFSDGTQITSSTSFASAGIFNTANYWTQLQTMQAGLNTTFISFSDGTQLTSTSTVDYWNLLNATNTFTSPISLTNSLITFGITNTYGIRTSTIQITSGASAGYVLTSDSNGNASWQAPSGSGTGTALQNTISQTSHGFVPGTVVRISTVTQTYVKACADIADNSEVIGIVSTVTDGNNFKITTSGLITGLTGLTTGHVYYLSDVTSGTYTTAEPTSYNTVSKPLFTAISSTMAFVNISRGYLNTPLSSGIIYSTHVVTIHSGGDVYIASGSYIPIMGACKVIDEISCTITGIRAYTLYTSTAGSTFFSLGISTTTDNTGIFSNINTSMIEVSTNTKYSNWMSVNYDIVTLPSVIFLQTNIIPASGTLPSEYGIEIRYRRRIP